MAPVDGPDRRDRAQMVLVGALALAVSLVVLAVVLNSAIYTENLATRSGEAGTGAVVDARESIRDDVGGITDRTNENHAGEDFVALTETHLSASMHDWRPMVARHMAVYGRTIRVGVVDNAVGTRIADESVGTFEPSISGADAPGFGSSNWLVAPPVEVRHFRLSQISASDLTSASASFDPQASNAFFVAVRETGGSDEWQVALYEDGGRVGVQVWDDDEESPVGSCLTDSTATVDLTRATLNGQRCEPLAFLDNADGLMEIHYVNGANIRGTYELTVDRVGHGSGGPLKDEVDTVNYGNQCSGPTYYDSPSEAGDGSPYATAAIYSTTVNFRYVSQSVTYETDVRVANDEPGLAAEHPKVTELTVTDNSGDSDASFEVSWKVADPNGNLENVMVRLQGEDVEGSTDVSGGSASGTVTLSESDDDDDTYTIVVEVVDGEGHSRSSSEVHVANGDDSECQP